MGKLDASNAKKVEQVIIDHYTHEGTTYLNMSDLIGHLVRGFYDTADKVPFPYNGFDLADDRSMAAFTFRDDSVLIVSVSGGTQSTN